MSQERTEQLIAKLEKQRDELRKLVKANERGDQQRIAQMAPRRLSTATGQLGH